MENKNRDAQAVERFESASNSKHGAATASHKGNGAAGSLVIEAEDIASAGDVEARDEWGDVESLGVRLDALPYPTDALPAALRAAVEEVRDFVQAPVGLVACSALAALSAAAQGMANVRRDAQLVGPASVYLLTVADSGERKTSADEFFSRAVHEWERDVAAVKAPDVARAAAERAAFEEKRAGIQESIRRTARAGKNSLALETALCDLLLQEPEKVIVPRLLYVDVTPESLAFELSHGHPCGAMLSAEAGAILGGHAMSADTVMRNLALLNTLWDGGEMRVDRRTQPGFTIRGRRLSVGLMVQEITLRDFLERARGLARGTGFLARFLTCWPVSTQGTRTYRSAPKTMPALAAYSRRVRALLDAPLQTDERGDLTPPELSLSAKALQAWIRFHDGVERELGDRGELRDIRDVGSKAAENVARVAGLLHILDHGAKGEISSDHVIAAGRIVSWHLGEAQRLLGALDVPDAVSNAILLERWLRAEALRTGDERIPTREIRRLGPNAVRQDAELSAALAELATRQRARFRRKGKRRFIEINPAIVTDTEAGI